MLGCILILKLLMVIGHLCCLLLIDVMVILNQIGLQKIFVIDYFIGLGLL